MSTNVSEERLDLRIRRTHKLLWEALMEMLNEQDFEEISVKDICDRAMVHRTTFYKHYQDKYDLLFRGMREMHDALIQEINSKLDAVEADLPIHRFTYIFQHIADHQQFYRVMLCGEGIGSFQLMLRSYLAERYKPTRCELDPEPIEPPVPLAIGAQFWAGALIGVVTWWLENNMPHPPEEMARYMIQLRPNAPCKYLSDAHSPRTYVL